MTIFGRLILSPHRIWWGVQSSHTPRTLPADFSTNIHVKVLTIDGIQACLAASVFSAVLRSTKLIPPLPDLIPQEQLLFLLSISSSLSLSFLSDT